MLNTLAHHQMAALITCTPYQLPTSDMCCKNLRPLKKREGGNRKRRQQKEPPTHNKKRLVITFNAGFLKRPSSGNSLIYLTTENKENRPNQGRGEKSSNKAPQKEIQRNQDNNQNRFTPASSGL